MRTLIEHARELAALRTGVTPGPWIAVGHQVEVSPGKAPDICTCDPSALAQGHLHRPETEILANGKLIAASPDMADLLEQLADRLEAFEQWARDMCTSTCGAWPTGKHASNCPVSDLQIVLEDGDAL